MARMIALRKTVRLMAAAAALAAVLCSSAALADVHVCLQYGTSPGTFYDIRGNSSGTWLERYSLATSPPSFVDSNWYAALQPPNPAGSMWGDGVAYAATMQTRSAWVNADPNTAAFWDHDSVTGHDTWRFQTTVGGTPTELVFRTSQCSPPPPPPNRVCLQSDFFYYEIRAEATETLLLRWNTFVNPPTFVDSNWYAALQPPNPAGSMWGDAVAYAATMQTRNAWSSNGPITAAWRDVDAVTGQQTWRFESNGATIDTYRSVTCRDPSVPTGSPASTTTIAPPPVPTTTIAPPPAPTTLAPGAHRVCLQSDFFYYEVRTDAAGTTLDRWNTFVNPPAFMDANPYAALQQPNPAGSMWGDGVAFAATMVSRNKWSSNGPITAAWWDVDPVTGKDTWRFESHGATIDTYRSVTCRDPSVPTPAPQ